MAEIYNKKLTSVKLGDISIKDEFWCKYIKLVKEVIIPYQWDILNDKVEGAEPSHCLNNFKIAAGDKEGEFGGAVFQDTDIAKWLEAVAYSLASHRNTELENIADEVIDLIGRAQCEDGYINTYFTIKEPMLRWTNLTEGHELYTAGHLLEAAIAYYNATGKDKFLNIMISFADLICETFGDGKKQGYPGHQEIELALYKLYEVTGEKKYIETARYFLMERGKFPNFFLEEEKKEGFKRIFPEFEGYLPLYSQSHLPITEQKTAEGHAVRAVYMYCAMADIAKEYEDIELFNSCKILWDNIVNKRMYITGSIGSSGILERFTADYDLPNDYNYSETCASIGLALFGLRMAKITKESKYIDVVERALYNTVLSGIAMDGKSFFYVNPLEVWPESCLPRTSKEHVKAERQKWFGVACCPPNIARTLASLGQYIYMQDKKRLYVNLFVSNESTIKLENKNMNICIESNFPNEGKINIKVNSNNSTSAEIAIRIPEYADKFTISKNGEIYNFRIENGYAIISDSFQEDNIEVSFNMPATFIYSNPLVRANFGRVAITKGPIVYCLEEIDNGDNLSAIYIDTDHQLREVYDEDLLDGTTIIYAKGMKINEQGLKNKKLYSSHKSTLSEVTLKAIPYAYWGNRGYGEMMVWVKER